MPLIVAVDRPLDPGQVSRICEYADGVKVGLPPVVSRGVEWARSISRSCNGLRILDFKLADIGPVMLSIVEPFKDYYDGFIAHSFIGSNGALIELKEVLDEWGAKLILVASMSHEGSREVYDRARMHVYEVIERVHPWGLVAPATRPGIVAELRARFPWARILSPGIGAQGARPGDALCSGADYEIVGRAITGSPNPVDAARRIRGEMENARSECS